VCDPKADDKEQDEGQKNHGSSDNDLDFEILPPPVCESTCESKIGGDTYLPFKGI